MSLLFPTCRLAHKPKAGTCRQPEELILTKCLLCHVARGTLLLKMHKVFCCMLWCLSQREMSLLPLAPCHTKKAAIALPQHNCSHKQALIMHIMHSIIHVSLSAGKQLHLWMRTLSKLGEPNCTSRQLFADLPKTIWWSQPSSSQAGVCFTANIRTARISDKLASRLSRKARAGLAEAFSPLGPRADSPRQGGQTGNAWDDSQPPARGWKESMNFQSSQSSPQGVCSTESNWKSKNSVD